jgi:hypothetical protein
VALMITDHSIDPTIRGSLPKTPASAKASMAKIKEYFQGSSKANASMLMTKMMHAKYDGYGSVREHILKMIEMSNKLKDLEMPFPDPYVIHYILLSLPSIFENFKINYNGSDKKWTLAELIAKCSQEEERLRTENKDYVNLISQGLKKIFSHGQSSGKFGGKSSLFKKGKRKKSCEKRPNNHPKKEAPKVEGASEKKRGTKCLQCKDWGHIRRECAEFKMWIAKKGTNDIISFIDKSLFTYYSLNTWCIDSGVTVHVTNSSQGFLGMRTIRGERNLKVANGHEARVEVVGPLPLVLYGGFTLLLNNVLDVPSLQRNLIFVSLLETDGYQCLFGNNKCTIIFNDKVVGLAPRQGMLYILSLNDFPVMNVCDVTNKRKKSASDNETSSKLWHCRLGHILRGRMEHLIKEDILQLLDFSDLDHCVEYIKGKFIKHIKKSGATRSSNVLEIIHTDICGPFNVMTVDGFNSFITFIDDYSFYGYIYPIHE